MRSEDKGGGKGRERVKIVIVPPHPVISSPSLSHLQFLTHNHYHHLPLLHLISKSGSG